MVEVVIQRLDKLDARIDRLDMKLNEKIDRGFENINSRMDRSFEAINNRLDRLYYLLFGFLTALIAGLLALLAKVMGVF